MTGRCGVVVAHGRLGEGLLSALTRVAGSQDNLWSVSNDERDTESLMSEIESLIAERGLGRETILFSDLDGGSCCQACRRLLASDSVRAVFYGVNLPLLIEFVFLQDLPFDEFCRALLEKSRGALGVHS